MPSFLRDRDPNVRTVYLAAFLLGAAYGLAIALISLHLDARGFDKTTIGQLAAWFAAGIVSLSIPLSIAAGVAGLFLTGQTINLMTLGGLALAIGLLVDNATVTGCLSSRRFARLDVRRRVRVQDDNS